MLKNNLPAGRGSDTLRDAEALYIPIKTRTGIAVVSFCCLNSKLTVTTTSSSGKLKPC